MKLYTVAWQGRTLVCLENTPGKVTTLPYETMNQLLTDDPQHRQKVLEAAQKEAGTLLLDQVRFWRPFLSPGRM